MRRAKSRPRGRPKGSTVPLERHRQKFAIAAWWGFRECGCGPYVAAYWAAVATGSKPIKPEDIEGLLTVATIEIERTASSLDKHLDRLVRNAKRATSNDWLRMSALAIKILAARTGNIAVYCAMLDVLIELGWQDVIARLSARIIDAAKSNVPPHEGNIGRQGQALLDRLRQATAKKP